MKVTWIIWATLDSITLYGMWTTNTLNFQIVGAVCGAWIVAALAVKYGEAGWTALDTFCSCGAALGIALMMLGIPTLGILASVGSTFIASFPTFRSAWNDPSKEDGFAWIVYWLSCYAAVHAIPAITLADIAQPTCFFAIESIMLALIFVKPWLQRQFTKVIDACMNPRD
jgi:hypothetical protein